MIIYKDKYTIPLWNWLMIQEKGFDLSYLLRFRFLKRFVNKKKIFEIYMNIVYTLENINPVILTSYVKWQILYLKFKAKYLRKEKNIQISNYEKTFRLYLETMQSNYKQFNITEYYFNPDYKEIFDTLEVDKKNLKALDKFKDIKFYTWDEYHIFLQKNPELIILGVLDVFKEKFILKRIIKIDNLVKLDNYLIDIYSQNQMYNEYQFVRSNIFDMNNLKSEIREKKSVFEEVATISEIVGYNINTKKTSLAEYEAIKETAKRKVEMSKPKAAGHGTS